MFFFFKQKTAYEMRISDWSSDVCSSDLLAAARRTHDAQELLAVDVERDVAQRLERLAALLEDLSDAAQRDLGEHAGYLFRPCADRAAARDVRRCPAPGQFAFCCFAFSAKEIGRASCRERVCQ